ncbi:antitoxin Xre/MbcA/ParS toxin-binding domain-containing protein [Dyadobacter sp. NIV53]|uniref:antitoxin Xre/MbcA/ParS toxin-binding domain-containing protein n=1 Tax=Dyadobacter sp. NIV53 TaxID=2861765 RepID=UPI001C853F81|nr:antitoxin Xre/MbcA/ParS toxin-binding domain-containing protein [Dyadobacter sp. NIV53]
MAQYKIVSDRYIPYGLKSFSDFTIIKISREGMPRSAADEVSELVKLTDNEMAYLLGMTPRNLHRIPSDKRLGTDASERLLLLKNLLIHALATFEGKDTIVRNWLKTPLYELNDQTPLQMMDTITGFGLVDDVLGRLDYGLPA